MDKSGWELRARGDGFGRGVELMLFRSLPDGRLEVAHNPTVQVYSDNELIPRAALHCIDRQAAQQLMDDLYAAGIRPTNEQDVRGVAAHLEDMRAIAFGYMQIDKP